MKVVVLATVLRPEQARKMEGPWIPGHGSVPAAEAIDDSLTNDGEVERHVVIPGEQVDLPAARDERPDRLERFGLGGSDPRDGVEGRGGPAVARSAARTRSV